MPPEAERGELSGNGRPRAPFGVRLAAARAEKGSLCVGIDPHPSLLAAADGVVGACDDDGVAATVERLLELPTD